MRTLLERTKDLFDLWPKEKTSPCPLCNGTGGVPFSHSHEFHRLTPDAKKEVIRMMRNKRLTFRQILKATGLRSTSAVQYWIRKDKRDAAHNPSDTNPQG